jgi:hypothetical protein
LKIAAAASGASGLLLAGGQGSLLKGLGQALDSQIFLPVMMGEGSPTASSTCTPPQRSPGTPIYPSEPGDTATVTDAAPPPSDTAASPGSSTATSTCTPTATATPTGTATDTATPTETETDTATPKPVPEDYKNIIFLHHSTGRYLISGGNVRQILSGLGYQFWDHDYNVDGLLMPNGAKALYTYKIPNDNTNPDGFDAIFRQLYYAEPVHPQEPVNAFSGLMRHSVICFKSCFPASKIWDDATLNQYKTHYLNIRSRIAQYPKKIFIPLSPPPNNTCETNSQMAARARAFANWLSSSEYTSGIPNIYPFNLFDILAESDPSSSDYNMLREEYRKPSDSYCDSHPNPLANETIGSILASFVDNAIRDFTNEL